MATRKTQTKKTSAKKAGSSKSSAAAKRNDTQPVRREVWAVICLCLSVFTFLGFFSADGLFISFIKSFMRGLIGGGYYLLPFSFLGCAVILGFHRGRPVRLRVVCSLLLPVILGCLLHLFICSTEYEWKWSMLKALYNDGMAGGAQMSGGAVAGFVAILFSALFSKIGSIIVLAACFIWLLLTVFNISISGIADAIRERPRREYDLIEDDRPVYPPSELYPPKSVRQKNKKKPFDAENAVEMKAVPMSKNIPRQAVDIDVDDPPALPKQQKSLYDPTPGVATPDQVLLGQVKAAVPASEPRGTKTHTEPENQTQVQQTPPLRTSAIQSEPAKVTKAEAEKAYAEISMDIEKNEQLEPERPFYIQPPLELLTQQSAMSTADGTEETRINAQRLSSALKSFGISADICNITRGPSVTRYEVELEQGVKLNRLTNLADDIALSLGSTGVRIAPIPDKISIVGIEVPNKLTNIVSLREIIDSDKFRASKSELTFAIGKDIGGNPIVGDISRLPHMLIAGTTGSGKSVCMNSLIISLLYKSSPEDVRLIMVDPKMIELGVYNGIPHLLIPVVTDPKKAAGALQWAVMEMLKRYRLFSEIGARDLSSYNAAVAKTGEAEKKPRIVILIDELADLMLVAAKDVEESICRVAQMGRAAGIHLVVATQRPSADVITGLMKANIPSRIAFAVDSALNSRIILDQMGAEKLVGKGDMLYSPLGSGKPIRVQGTFVTDTEREDVIEFVKSNSLPRYDDEVQHEVDKNAEGKEPQKGSDNKADFGFAAEEGLDELFEEAVAVILESGQASVSMLQRRLKLGYSRAARLVDQMEDKGIVGPFEGSKPRQLLVSREQWNAMRSGQNPPEPTLFDLDFDNPQEEEDE